MNSRANPTQALLFDLGGVVLEVDFARAFRRWQASSSLSLEEINNAFSVDEAYRGHETGHWSADRYFDHLRQSLSLGCSTAEVAAGWNDILVREIGETAKAIQYARTLVPCYALSNTNATHLAELWRKFPDLMGLFESVFTSHEIGARKPHADTYNHVLDAIGVPAGQVLFFDDLPENVQAAQQCGLQACLVRGADDVLRELAARQLAP